MSGDELYDDDVTSGVIDPPKPTPHREYRDAGCSTCARDPRGMQMMPPHQASDRCESGKHNHCSCDTCF